MAKNIKLIAILLLITAIIIASYVRIYFGVDLTDESFYISLPYRFILGDRPILDEYSMYQFAGTLLYPFYKFYYLARKNTDGIILFGRHLYLLFSAFLGFSVFQILRRFLDFNAAILISGFCLLYIPFNIMGLSYNTIAMLTFTLGTFISFNFQQRNEQNLNKLFLIGFSYSLSVYVYPTFLIPVLLSTGLMCLYNNYKKIIMGLLLGALPIFFVGLFLLGQAHFEYQNLFNYIKQTGYANKDLAQLGSMLTAWVETLPHWGISIILAGALILKIYSKTSSKWQKLSYVVFFIFPFILVSLYLLAYYQTEEKSIWYYLLINCSLLAPLYFPFCKKPFVKNLIRFIWVPSFLAGIVTSLTSANEFVNFMIGLLPSFLASMAIIYLALTSMSHELTSMLRINTLKNLICALPLTFLYFMAIVLLIYKFSYIYRDASIGALNNRINQGPYKYLMTSSQQGLAISVMNYDLKNMIKLYRPQNIFVYPSFSGLYLFTPLRPLTNSVWLFAKFNNALTVNFFEHLHKKPDLAVIFKPYLRQTDDIILTQINPTDYIEVLDRKLYTIYISRKLLNEN